MFHCLQELNQSDEMPAGSLVINFIFYPWQSQMTQIAAKNARGSHIRHRKITDDIETESYNYKYSYPLCSAVLYTGLTVHGHLCVCFH